MTITDVRFASATERIQSVHNFSPLTGHGTMGHTDDKGIPIQSHMNAVVAPRGPFCANMVGATQKLIAFPRREKVGRNEEGTYGVFGASEIY